MAALEQEIGRLLRQRGMTLGVVESATGGLLSQLITDVAGSSDYFKGAIVAYSDGIKVSVVGVKAATIGKYGAVSPQVAEAMAAHCRERSGSDYALSVTGIAGPTGGTAQKPVGLTWFGLASPAGTHTERHVFAGDRRENRDWAARVAVDILRRRLTRAAE